MKLFRQSILFLLILFFSGCTDTQNAEKKSETIAQKTSIDTTAISLSYLVPLHKRKTFKRYDRSLTEYIHSNPNKPDSLRKIIYLLPLGNMKPEIEEIIKEEVEYLKRFFQLEVKILERVPFDEIKNKKVKTRFVPDNEYDHYTKLKGNAINLREQIEANSLIENYIKEIKPKDAIALLGITEHDLYIPKMNYIYGTSYLKNGIGIISTYRITDYLNESKLNIRKVASKQITNLFSIPNVKDYVCVLNFHNNIHELRQGVLYLSPKALEKLKYCLGFEYEKRFKELKEYYKEEGMKSMEEYYDKCLKDKDLQQSKS